MKTSLKNTLKDVMNLAWSFVKKNGFSMSEALRVAWRNIKLRSALAGRIVKFHFSKVDGSIREAYGTLKDGAVPETSGHRKTNESVQTYYDTEKAAWRCFKKANLIDFNF